ncbi:hypothetical protein J7E37_01755 [Bacillus sp. ISL-39]|nr:hypothetical protein [Bacillus sp. ISL-39]
MFKKRLYNITGMLLLMFNKEFNKKGGESFWINTPFTLKITRSVDKEKNLISRVNNKLFSKLISMKKRLDFICIKSKRLKGFIS